LPRSTSSRTYESSDIPCSYRLQCVCPTHHSSLSPFLVILWFCSRDIRDCMRCSTLSIYVRYYIGHAAMEIPRLCPVLRARSSRCLYWLVTGAARSSRADYRSFQMPYIETALSDTQFGVSRSNVFLSHTTFFVSISLRLCHLNCSGVVTCGMAGTICRHERTDWRCPNSSVCCTRIMCTMHEGILSENFTQATLCLGDTFAAATMRVV
jgi:hypothetical protein